MIEYELVDAFFSKITALLEIPCLREDYKFKKEEIGFPYITYKILNISPEDFYKQGRVVTKNINDGSLADINIFEQSKTYVSINIFGTDKEFGLAKKLREYIRLYKNDDYVVRIISPEIEDRTIFLNIDYDYRVGFDIRIDHTEKIVNEIEAIRSIEITPVINGSEKKEIIIKEI